MKTKIYNVKLLLIALGLQSLPVFAANQTSSVCTAKGYTLGFFNGVWNTRAQAISGREALRALVGDSYNSEKIKYELFYNHTGSTAGGSGLQDIAEVFQQRALEIDSSGNLGKHWELFWESLSSKDTTFIDKIKSFFPNSSQLFSSLYTDLNSKILAGWSYFLSNPPTAADYAQHDTRLTALATEGQKLILVAHSQGNLFVNHAYDYITPLVGVNSVAVAHIAPASSTLRGGYLLADIDLVINGLRTQGLSSVPNVNLSLPTSVSDLSGHTLVGTYLDGSRPGRQAVEKLITNAVKGLVTPTTTGSIGSFTVTLTWDGSGDVDLHTFEPSGSHVYYSARAGVVGYLDVDNTNSLGPEHYYASCDSSVLQAGTYRVGINNYARATGRTATVQVSTPFAGVILNKTVGVGSERGSSGNQSPINVLNVDVSKDATTGQFTFSAH